MNDYKIRRQKDEKDEKIVAEYLDNYFYPTFTTTITRNDDKETQIKGLDVTVEGKSGVTYTIDEKAATHWAGRNLQTFAHEINSVNTLGRVYDGWLLDFHSASDYLVEVWIDELNSDYLRKPEDIKDCTVSLIKKSDLYDYLRIKGVSSKDLTDIGNYLREIGQPNMSYKGFKITCQMNYQEKAANILIPRNTLINTISTYTLHIKDGHKEILR